MKGLYWQQDSSGEEIGFVFLEKDNHPVVRDNYVKVQVKACALSWIDKKAAFAAGRDRSELKENKAAGMVKLNTSKDKRKTSLLFLPTANTDCINKNAYPLLSDIKMEKEFLPVGREIAGVVLEIGNKVSSFQPHDDVVGILPLDSEDSGLCEVILVHEHYLAHKPEKVSWLESAGTIRDGVRAYTALHYLSYISPGKTVLIMDGASPFGIIAIQLAQHRGAKVIATVYSPEDRQYLERLTPSVARIVDESNGKYDLTESCLEETGGLGVDIILDAGVRLYSKENEATSQQLLPHKHDIITLLSVGGHWVTTEENLQLDPPDSHSLFLKGATVSFLNEEVWNLSNMQQGKYLCILEDIMDKLSSGIFRPHLDEPVPLYEAKVSMEMVQKNQARKRQVVQL